MGSNVLDQSSLVLLAMEDQGSCITLRLRIRDPVSVLYVLRLRIRDPVSVSYVLRNLVKVWCLDNTGYNLYVTPHRTGFSTTEFSKDLLSTCPASTHTNSLPNINSIFLQCLDVFKSYFLYCLKNYHIFVARLRAISCFKLRCPHLCDNYGDGTREVWE